MYHSDNRGEMQKIRTIRNWGWEAKTRLTPEETELEPDLEGHSKSIWCLF